MNYDINDLKQRFGIIGNDPTLIHAIEVAIQVAHTDLSVLVSGENGVGKENFPKIIHACSTRKHGNYFAVNCGAIPEGTIDSELFGHEKGAFTDAKVDRKGYFEIADQGTLFLDEVGELPLSTQVRLLRVLETGEFIKMGSSVVQKTDVRVVAATNADLRQQIVRGRFREDLYYRLNTVEIKVPPLRERKDDIYLLFRKFANDCSEKYNTPVVRLTEKAQEVLRNYYWDGNVRQLKNVTEQLAILEAGHPVDETTLNQYLPVQVGTTNNLLPTTTPMVSHENYLDERELLYKVLFDMRHDMSVMKEQIAGLLAGKSTPLGTPGNGSPTVLPTTVIDATEEEAVVVKDKSLREIEKEHIVSVLEKHNGNRRLAAEELHIPQRTLYRRIKEYGL